jgi:hypothetical protein
MPLDKSADSVSFALIPHLNPETTSFLVLAAQDFCPLYDGSLINIIVHAKTVSNLNWCMSYGSPTEWTGLVQLLYLLKTERRSVESMGVV